MTAEMKRKARHGTRLCVAPAIVGVLFLILLMF